MDLQSPMEFLEVPLGLSANLFADDLDIDGSILDLGLDEGLKKSNATHQSLEDLLLSEPVADPLGEEWMETLNVEPFLESMDFGLTDNVMPVNKVAADVLDISSLLNASDEVEPEPRKEGMKASAFELLKALLTDQQPIKTEIVLDSLQTSKLLSKVAPAATSPVAEVPMFDFSGCSSATEDAENTILQSFEDLIQPDVELGNENVIKIDAYELVNVVSPSEVSSTDNASYISSPLNDESVLLSSPSSPFESTEELSTINSSYLSDDGSTCSVKSSQVSDENFTKLKSKSKRAKAKSSPYDSDYSPRNVSDKRQRKKMQNKNAATRYRVKKRHEKESLQEQEVRLSDKNKELRDKVESLQREIQYMKELMHEINKAKKSKI